MNNIHTTSYDVMNAPQRPAHFAPVGCRMAAGISEQTRTKTHGHCRKIISYKQRLHR
jgi:hypothetical protein